MDQRQGRPAEKIFSLLCSREKITCNKSEEDDHGWDFIVEVPMPTPARLPADLLGEVRKCEVQVKSSDGEKPVAKLSLNNARAFAQSTLPCFVVVILDQNSDSPRVFIRHFWKEEIKRSLKRVREAELQGKPLNKTFMQITLSDQEEHTPDAISWLVEFVRGLPIGYSDEKKQLTRSVGYENHVFKGVITFGPMDNIEQLVDHQLGLTGDLPVTHIRMVDNRFKLSAQFPFLEGQPTSVSMRSCSKIRCKLLLRSKSGESMTLSAMVTAPAIPNLSIEATKLRIETKFLDLVIAHGVLSNTSLNVDFANPLPLDDLDHLLKLLRWSEEGPIGISLVENGRPLADGEFRINRCGDEGSFASFSILVSLLLDLVGRSGAELPDVSLAAIVRHWEDCRSFMGLLLTSDASLNATFDKEVPPDAHPKALLGFAELNIETTAFFVILEFPVDRCDVTQNMMQFNLAAPKIRECFVSPEAGLVRQLGRNQIAAYEANTNDRVPVLGDILSILEA